MPLIARYGFDGHMLTLLYMVYSLLRGRGEMGGYIAAETNCVASSVDCRQALLLLDEILSVTAR